jgi:hypothetical protein
MNKRFLFLTAIFLLLMPTLLFARGGREKAKTVQVTGILRQVGHEPFFEMVISNSENEWYIPREEMDKLVNIHGTVTVEGEETVMKIKSANGLITVMRRELRNIRIIDMR